MPLTGPQHRQIQDALLAAFDEAGLRRLVKFELDQDLDQLTPPGDLTQRAYNLVAWADKQGRVPVLIAGALKQNPSNADLQTLATAAQTWHIEAAAEPSAKPPYQGLAYFDVADADRFFGREVLTAELVAYLKDHHFLAVVGASGSGKSSVVRAGVVTALTQGAIQGSEKWVTFIVTPTARPLETLALALLLPGEAEEGIARFKAALRESPDSLHLRARRLLSAVEKPRLLLVVDQFEELFTLCKDKAERRAFVDNLLTAAQPDGVTTVVLTLRADFYAHCAEYDNLRAALEQYQRYIGAMAPDELRAAIEKPATQGGWDLEPGLVDLMLDDVAEEPGALPLLSFALLETWKRRSGRTLTFAGYRAAGGVREAIAKKADEVYRDLTPDEQVVARNVFLRLTTLGESGQDTRRRVPLQELASLADVEAVLQKLENARLVTAVREGEPDATQPVTFVGVTHEALIREWPRLREWLAEDREGLRLHRKLTEAAQEWEGLDRDPGALYRGVQLQQAQEWAAGHDAELNELERSFLAASRTAVQAQEVRELQQARTARNRALMALAAATAALILSVVVGWFLYQQNQALEGERLLKEARQLKEALDPQGAIAKFQAAVDADPTLDIDLSAEISDTLRFVATTWVQEGEAVLRAARSAGAADPSTQSDEPLAIEPDSPLVVGAETSATTTQPPSPLTLPRKAQVAIQSNSLTWAAASAPHLAGWSPDASLFWQQAVISATALFTQALALNPPSDTPVYVWIEPGDFLMGSSDEDSVADINEKPQHTVKLDGYWIQRTEVTNEQYKRCVEAKVCSPPDNLFWNKPRSARLPVTHVDWNQAKTYAEWVGGRLPTEAEWEKACRGTEGLIYPWGDEPPSPELANYYPTVGNTTDVGTYPPGTNDLYDMAGNVYEWTADLYDGTYYRHSPEYNPPGPKVGVDHTLRGGAWINDDFIVRCAYRDFNRPGEGGYNVGYRNGGFRVVTP